MKHIKTIISTSSDIITEGISSILKERFSNNIEIHMIDDYNKILPMAMKIKPDILFVDISILIQNGINDFKKIKKNIYGKIVLLKSMEINSLTLNNFEHIISIFEEKDNIYSKIEKIIAEDDRSTEQEQLSDREEEILICIVKGMSNKDIANKLSISIHTVISHRRNLCNKLQINSVGGLTIYAISNNLINLDNIN